LVVGIGATSAMAGPPTWETVTVDDTYLLPRTSAACGFEVYKHDYGTLKIQTVVADGSVRIHDVAVQIDSIISAPSSGNRCSSIRPAPAAAASPCTRTARSRTSHMGPTA